MLCQFTVKNYRSYKDETTLDMQATGAPELPDTLLRMDGDQKPFLPVSVIYGPNGGGKSNMLHALFVAVKAVTYPIAVLSGQKNIAGDVSIETCEPFLFDESSRNQPTEFELFFRMRTHEYRYVLHLFNGEVIQEGLYRRTVGGKRTATMFLRENGVVTPGPILRKQNVSTQVNAQLPYLSFLSITYDFSEIREAVDWFRSVEIANFANPRVDERIMVLGAETEAKSLFLTMLNNMGISIEDYRVEREAESERIKDLYVARSIDGKRYELPIGSESDGTRKLFSLIPLMIRVLSKGAVLIVDELDAKLHPMLIRYLIQLFKSPDINRSGAQLLFTSHDLSTMTGEIFRRDEIWFACRNNEEASELYSLYEIRDEENHRVRANAAFDKRYLEGRYGADPYLKRMLSWEA